MIINGDCLEEMKKMEDNSVDSIVTDPPYGLSFMGKKWDYDVPSKELWIEAMRVLKPGGHLLSFAGSRTYHRMAVNIEDAGFEIRDQIMWVYGSGFPKSHNIGKAVDKTLGAEREVVGTVKITGHGKDNVKHGTQNRNKLEFDKLSDKAITPEAKKYEGWGTALKPAHEPIVVARKPFKGTVAENVLKYGTGGINIDGCRVGTEEIKINQVDLTEAHGNNLGAGTKQPFTGEVKKVQGRFPANFIHDGIETKWARFFYCAKASRSERNKGLEGLEDKDVSTRSKEVLLRSNDVTKEQMYEVGNYIKEQMNEKNINVKTLNKEFDYVAGCNWWLSKNPNNIRIINPSDYKKAKEVLKLDDRYDNLLLSNLYTEPKSIVDIASKSNKNNHPTVKPVALMQYLVRLVTPTKGIVLDPFMGSGTTGIACNLEGFDFIGIEISEEYCKIAQARLDNCQQTLL